ncbi:hypothetical protein F2P56_033365 [Juglans regia]|uniref:Reverse transcriptase Ty1/copia-type domain-containing protein n=1 Tax=Juglans regia TaxID=51240 RepID=A0A833TH52_JUGRE|nr:hypothetical protein F2P56_033365 [Juglans regia]
MEEEGNVFSLRKALYRLKQTHRAWYGKIVANFVQQGFVKSKKPTLYKKIQGEVDILLVSLYVDDLIFTRNNLAMIRRFKNDIMSSFEKSDLGFIHYFLGVEVC